MAWGVEPVRDQGQLELEFYMKQCKSLHANGLFTPGLPKLSRIAYYKSLNLIRSWLLRSCTS